jgi:phenylalanine-4-hydroxylase
MPPRVTDWNQYTADDHEVWGLLATRQWANLQTKAWSSYLTQLEAVGMPVDQVPKFSALEERLGSATGWSIEIVDGIIPVDQFLRLLSRRRFCSSTWLRARHQLDYLEEPDMFHDIFGHIPLLMDPEYAEFIRRFGEMGSRWTADRRALLLLERVYWFTIEFGLIREKGDLRILGAGILSSFGESNHVFDDEVELRPYSVEGVLYQPFHNNEVQQLYFVVEHPSDLWRSLERTEEIIAEVVRGERPEAPFRFGEQVGSVKSEPAAAVS